jgi:hypothetical protein
MYEIIGEVRQKVIYPERRRSFDENLESLGRQAQQQKRR